MSDHEKHSRFGGSIIGRVIACPGSVALCDSVPPGKPSIYAEEGTFAHKVGEYCLREGLRDADQFLTCSLPLGYDPSGRVPGDEVVNAINRYLEAVYTELDAEPDNELYVEESFTLDIPSADPGEVFGRNDAMVYSPSRGRLVVFDYKHGVGVSVSADDNAQLKFYAAGAVFSNPHWRVREVVLVIVQPRSRDADENDGGVKPWPISIVDLMDFTGDVDLAVLRAKGPAPTLSAGSHCRWCAAAAVCPAREQNALAATGLDYADITEVTADALPEPKTLDVERLGKVLVAIDILNDWGAQVREYVEALLLSGQEVPGWKVVQKLGRRKWIDSDEQIATWLSLVHGLDEELVRPRRIATITEVERLLKAAVPKDDLAEAKAALELKFTVKESSGLTMAPSSDRREAVNAVASDYANVNG